METENTHVVFLAMVTHVWCIVDLPTKNNNT